MIIQKPVTHNFSNYLIVILSIFSINPFFATAATEFNLIFLVIIYLIARVRGAKLMDKKINILILSLFSLIILQAILYKGFSIATIHKPFILLYIPYLIYNLLGISYFRYFNKVLFIIALYTTPLWLMQSISPSFDHMMRGFMNDAFEIGWNVVPRSLLFYTSPWADHMFNNSLGIYRNSGLFHEPGAYGIMLNIGIVTNTMITGKLLDKKNILFILCVLTTLSTAGYITLFIVVSAILYTSKISMVIKMAVLSVFAYVSFTIYQQEEFLQSKVETQYEDQTYAAQQNFGRDRGQSGRFFAFFTAARELMENPVTGRGIIYKTSKKSSGEMHQDSSYGYGFIGVFMVFGVPFGLFYMLKMYQGFRRIGIYYGRNNLFVWASFIAINLALLTQVMIMISTVVLFVMIGIYEGSIKQLTAPKIVVK